MAGNPEHPKISRYNGHRDNGHAVWGVIMITQCGAMITLSWFGGMRGAITWSIWSLANNAGVRIIAYRGTGARRGKSWRSEIRQIMKTHFFFKEDNDKQITKPIKHDKTFWTFSLLVLVETHRFHQKTWMAFKRCARSCSSFCGSNGLDWTRFWGVETSLKVLPETVTFLPSGSGGPVLMAVTQMTSFHQA